MGNSHSEFVLLRSCLSLPKVNFLLCTCPPFADHISIWKNFDDNLQEAMNTILGSNITDEAWLQAQLPVSQSGLGIRSACLHASSSFIASALEADIIVSELLNEADPEVPNLDIALAHLSCALETDEPLVKEVLKGVGQ